MSQKIKDIYSRIELLKKIRDGKLETLKVTVAKKKEVVVKEHQRLAREEKTVVEGEAKAEKIRINAAFKSAERAWECAIDNILKEEDEIKKEEAKTEIEEEAKDKDVFETLTEDK